MSLGPQPLGVQCPLTFSPAEFSGYWERLGYPGLHPFISRYFFIHCSPTIGFHSCFFFTTNVSVPIRSILHLMMVNFQAWDWLWYPMLWSQRQNMGCP